MVDLSNFTSNKKSIEWSCRLSLQQSFLPNFIQNFDIDELKNFLGDHKFFFKGDFFFKIFKFIYNNWFFSRLGPP